MNSLYTWDCRNSKQLFQKRCFFWSSKPPVMPFPSLFSFWSWKLWYFTNLVYTLLWTWINFVFNLTLLEYIIYNIKFVCRYVSAVIFIFPSSMIKWNSLQNKGSEFEYFTGGTFRTSSLLYMPRREPVACGTLSIVKIS